MSPQRCQRRHIKNLERALRALETYIREARRDQTAGCPYAEAAINGGLEDWARVHAELAQEETEEST